MDEPVNHFSWFLDAAIASLQENMSARWLVGPLVGWLLVCWSLCHAGVTEVMKQIWDGLTAYYHCSVYASIPGQMQMVNEAEGGATK